MHIERERLLFLSLLSAGAFILSLGSPPLAQYTSLQSSEDSICPWVSRFGAHRTQDSDSWWTPPLFINVINGTGHQGTVLPAADLNEDFKLYISACPFTLTASFCFILSLFSRSQSFLDMFVCVSTLNRIDSLCALKDGYIRGPAGLTPSSTTLTFCLSLLKRPSHPLHSLIGHCHREKKAKDLP